MTGSCFLAGLWPAPAKQRSPFESMLASLHVQKLFPEGQADLDVLQLLLRERLSVIKHYDR